MDDIIKLSEDLSVFTRAPNEADLDAFSQNGARSVLNLRSAGEPGEVMTPDQEGEIAREKGLSYRNLPVTPATLNAETAARVRAELTTQPGPVVVHCASGRRAGLMALAYWAFQNGATASEAAEKGQSVGLGFNEADLQPLRPAGAPA